MDAAVTGSDASGPKPPIRNHSCAASGGPSGDELESLWFPGETAEPVADPVFTRRSPRLGRTKRARGAAVSLKCSRRRAEPRGAQRLETIARLGLSIEDLGLARRRQEVKLRHGKGIRAIASPQDAVGCRLQPCPLAGFIGMIDRHHVLLDCSQAGFDPVVALCRKSHSTAAQRTARSDERFMGDAVRDFEAGEGHAGIADRGRGHPLSSPVRVRRRAALRSHPRALARKPLAPLNSAEAREDRSSGYGP